MHNDPLYRSCTLCPRACGVDRRAGQRGFCGADSRLLCARASLHAWEEPCISGKKGSGTVFFSGCNLRCIYCQNHAISRIPPDAPPPGRVLSANELARVFLALQEQGAANINLVTPTHYLPHLLSAIPTARAGGLTLPIVYNCGGYERVESLALLEGLVDIYLTDLKYRSSARAKAYSAAEDYPAVAMRALREMVRQVGGVRFDEAGMLQRGVIVRHLVLPGAVEDAMELTSDLFALYGSRIILSLMNQYTPPAALCLPPPLNRPLSADEYDAVLAHAERLGMVRVYAQEGGTVSESFIPAFDGSGLPDC